MTRASAHSAHDGCPKCCRWPAIRVAAFGVKACELVGDGVPSCSSPCGSIQVSCPGPEPTPPQICFCRAWSFVFVGSDWSGSLGPPPPAPEAHGVSRMRRYNLYFLWAAQVQLVLAFSPRGTTCTCFGGAWIHRPCRIVGKRYKLYLGPRRKYNLYFRCAGKVQVVPSLRWESTSCTCRGVCFGASGFRGTFFLRGLPPSSSLSLPSPPPPRFLPRLNLPPPPPRAPYSAGGRKGAGERRGEASRRGGGAERAGKRAEGREGEGGSR
jgi:hypothetical protein